MAYHEITLTVHTEGNTDEVHTIKVGDASHPTTWEDAARVLAQLLSDPDISSHEEKIVQIP